MKAYLLFLPIVILTCHIADAATTCSRANLTRCLDSVCAINISSNPAARCQYCGTSGAGAPQKNNMRSVSTGTSAKYNISANELKKAPNDPGERYVWATKQCIAKVAGCTPDDVTATYDKLIEQSCTAAGISAQMTKLQASAKKTHTKSECESEITACVIAEKACNADYRNCEENTNFDKFFSACAVQSTGCDEFMSDIRITLLSERDNTIKNTDNILTQIITAYQNSRATKLSDTRTGCENNSEYDKCVETVCTNNMPDQCANNTELVSAGLLCQFHKIACNTLR